MNWHKVTLSHDDISAGRHIQLQEAFEAVFIASAAPADAGMFGGREASVHFYYFSPGAVRIFGAVVERYSGVECPAPARSGVNILVSHAGAEGIPFAPER